MPMSYQQLSKQNSDLDNELRDVTLDYLDLIEVNNALKDEIIRLENVISLKVITATNRFMQ